MSIFQLSIICTESFYYSNCPRSYRFCARTLVCCSFFCSIFDIGVISVSWRCWYTWRKLPSQQTRTRTSTAWQTRCPISSVHCVFVYLCNLMCLQRFLTLTVSSDYATVIHPVLFSLFKYLRVAQKITSTNHWIPLFGGGFVIDSRKFLEIIWFTEVTFSEINRLNILITPTFLISTSCSI